MALEDGAVVVPANEPVDDAVDDLPPDAGDPSTPHMRPSQIEDEAEKKWSRPAKKYDPYAIEVPPGTCKLHFPNLQLLTLRQSVKAQKAILSWPRSPPTTPISPSTASSTPSGTAASSTCKTSCARSSTTCTRWTSETTCRTAGYCFLGLGRCISDRHGGWS